MAEKNIKYKATWKVLVGGAVFVVFLLAASGGMLSSETEWHLGTTSSPIIIPNIFVQLIWWAGFLFGIAAMIQWGLPACTIRLEDNEILVQNPWTRRFSAISFDKLLQVNMDKSHIEIIGRTNRIRIWKAFLSKADFDFIYQELRSKIA